MTDAAAGPPQTPQRLARSGRRSRMPRGGPGASSTVAAGGDGNGAEPAGIAPVGSIGASVSAEELAAADGGDIIGPDGKVISKNDNAVTARLMKTKMCYFYERGKCASQNCRYAHSHSELRHVPNLQKTKLCKVWAQQGICHEGENCVFAHGETELRVTDGIYKTQMCHFFERGRCLKGDRCNHAHGPEDLRIPPAVPPVGEGGGATSSSGPKGAKARSGHGTSDNLASAAESAEDRAPLSPLPLAELLGEMGHTNSNAGCGGTTMFHHPSAFAGSFATYGATPEPGMYDGSMVASEVLALAAAGAAQFNGLHSQAGSLPLGPPPPPPALWSMAWTPNPSGLYGGCGTLATGTLGSPGSPSPLPPHLQGYSPTAPSPCPATPSPSPGIRHHGHHASVIGARHHMDAPWLHPPHGVGAEFASAAPYGDDREMPRVDLDQQLAKIDMVVTDMVKEVRELAVAANETATAPGYAAGWGVGGDRNIWQPFPPAPASAPVFVPATAPASASAEKVVHHWI